MKSLIAIAALSLTGCCLVPNTVSPVVEHVSHASQHFGPNRTNDGYNQLALVARWRVYKGAFLEMSEGVNLGRKCANGKAYDGLSGNEREVFTARVGYTFEVKP